MQEICEVIMLSHFSSSSSSSVILRHRLLMVAACRPFALTRRQQRYLHRSVSSSLEKHKTSTSPCALSPVCATAASSEFTTTDSTSVKQHLPRQQQRWYSSTSILNRKQKKPRKTNPADVVIPPGPVIKQEEKDEDAEDEDEDEPLVYDTINASNLSEHELAAIVAEEEAKLDAEAKSRLYLDWKPGQRKRPLQISYSLEEFQYELTPDKFPPRWTLRDKRCGALAIKVGMLPLWDHDTWGVRYPCTVLYLDNNIVLGHKTPDQHGYMSVQVAAGNRKRKNVGKCLMGQYQHILNIDDREEHPPYLVREFRISDVEHFIPIGTQIHARHFVPGQNVDVAGITKGKGFQGAMKRHGFAGMPASHGVSKSHRALGSTGQCQDPGKVFKGKKMAGRMGNQRVTKQNLRIVMIDRGRNLLYVHGAVPGNKGSFVEIRDAVKKPLWRTDMVEDSLDRPPLPTFGYDHAIDGCGEAGHEVFMPVGEKDPLDPENDGRYGYLPREEAG